MKQLITTLITLSSFSALASPAPCVTFGPAELIAALVSPDLHESSGLAISAQHDDLLWTHNDSGGAVRLYAFGLDGRDRGQLTFEESLRQVDWEGMGLGPCGEQQCLYIGDIGDNRRDRELLPIIRFPEPSPPGPGEELEVAVERIEVFYPDAPHDAEGLAIDPLTGDLIIIQKTLELAFNVYRVPASAWAEPELWVEAELLETLWLEGGLEALLVTRADIDPTGAELYLATYGAGYRFDLLRGEDQRISGFGVPRATPSYNEGQCEAAAYGPDGLSLYHTCEENPTPLARSVCVERYEAPLEPELPAEEPGASCGCESVDLSVFGLWAALLLLGRRPHRGV